MASRLDVRSWWRRREAPPAREAPPPPAPAHEAPTLPRPPAMVHHWLTVHVARPTAATPAPVAGARVLVRPHAADHARPGATVARGTTRGDGAVTFLLPPGRYAVSARVGDEARAATLTLDATGRATLLLDALGHRVRLHVEAVRDDGVALAETRVHVRTLPGGALAAEGATDERGFVDFELPRGAYEVHVGGRRVQTFLETETHVRLEAPPTPRAPLPVLTAEALRARAALGYAAPFELAHARQEGWN